MSGGIFCKCGERSKPLAARAWKVTRRNYHCSAFAGYQETYSDYSSVRCGSCEYTWRTKAAYVAQLRDATGAEGKVE